MADTNKRQSFEVTSITREESSNAAGEVQKLQVAPNGNEMDHGLQRGLKGRHLQLFALGSVIG